MFILCIFGLLNFSIFTLHGSEVGLLKPINMQVNALVFINPCVLSHEDLVSFGLVCTQNDAYLRETASKRQEYILKMCPLKIEGLLWHKYGSRADYKKIINTLISKQTYKNLRLERLELLDNGEVRRSQGDWPDFEVELLHKPIPFYNQYKQLCFIGCGWIVVNEITRLSHIKNIIMYKGSTLVYDGSYIKKTQHESKRRCILEFLIKKKVSYKPLVLIVNFPYLLSAILNSPVDLLKKRSNGSSREYYYRYKLENVRLPQNYKECISVDNQSYNSFCELPNRLKRVIENHYKNQKK